MVVGRMEMEDARGAAAVAVTAVEEAKVSNESESSASRESAPIREDGAAEAVVAAQGMVAALGKAMVEQTGQARVGEMATG